MSEDQATMAAAEVQTVRPDTTRLAGLTSLTDPQTNAPETTETKTEAPTTSNEGNEGGKNLSTQLSSHY